MHVTTKEVDEKGTHILTSVLEADGPTEMCSDKATLGASVISISRTDSGGVKVQVAVTIAEPTPVVVAPVAVVKPPTLEEQAIAYFVDAGLKAEDAAKKVAYFGAQRVLAMKDKKLDEELASALK